MPCFCANNINDADGKLNSLSPAIHGGEYLLAKARKRTTILAEDMKEALEKTVGKKHLAWEELLQEIFLQTPIDLGNLSKGITKYIEDHQK